VVDKDGHGRPLAGVRDAAEFARALRLRVDGRVEALAIEDEDNRHEVRAPVRVDRREPGYPRGPHPLPHCVRLLHVGIIEALDLTADLPFASNLANRAHGEV
jgi:hypothetical protein